MKGEVVKEDGEDRHIKAGDDITEMWPTISWQFKSRMMDPWDIMDVAPVSPEDTDPDESLEEDAKRQFGGNK